MSERFQKLFSLKENLYAENVPVMISAGALTKDNQTEKVFMQLKIQNIDVKFRAIVALKVVFDTYDPTGTILEKSKEYQYLDLNAARGVEFGAKQPIYLENNTARSFNVTILDVVFSNGEIWNGENQVWLPLGKQKTLEEAIGTELAEQYRRDTFAGAKFETFANNGVWMCSCGTLNYVGDSACCCCHNNKTVLFNAIDHSRLAKNLDMFKKQQNEELVQKIKEKKKNVKKITLIILPLVLIVAILVGKFYIEKQRVRKEEEAREAAITTLKHVLCSDTWVWHDKGGMPINEFEFYADGTGYFTNVWLGGEDIEWRVIDGDTFEVYCPLFGSDLEYDVWDMIEEDGVYSYYAGDFLFYRYCDMYEF